MILALPMIRIQKLQLIPCLPCSFLLSPFPLSSELKAERWRMERWELDVEGEEGGRRRRRG
jgi:hypothetical protein